MAHEAPGTGLGSALLDRAEQQIATRSESAWLAVVAENLRARRFYDSRGWIDTGACINEAETGGGAVLGVPAHRYVERLTKEARS